MRATATADHDQNAGAARAALSPERRLDAIADIVVRGLARLLLAGDAATASDDALDAQVSGNTAESALLNGPRDALMVRRGEDPATAKGGRIR
jgi:hypothetical protein